MLLGFAAKILRFYREIMNVVSVIILFIWTFIIFWLVFEWYYYSENLHILSHISPIYT